MRDAVILYGPPAAGKDTITDRLTQVNDVYQHFECLKCGAGRTKGYRNIDKWQLVAIRSEPNEVLWESHRYGSIYMVDRSHLVAIINDHRVPVVHLGQVEAVAAVARATVELNWLVVELTCPRQVAVDRIARRDTGDAAARLQMFDETALLSSPDLRIDTSSADPMESAARIDRALYGEESA